MSSPPQDKQRIIKRAGVGSWVGNPGQPEKPKYCPRCENLNQHNPLKGRIYKPDEFGNVIIPEDDNAWLQCHFCGYILAVVHIQQYGDLVSDITPRSPLDPFKQQMQGVGGDKDERHARVPKRGMNERERKKIDSIKDEDVKKELRQGGKLVSYSER